MKFKKIKKKKQKQKFIAEFNLIIINSNNIIVRKSIRYVECLKD